MYLPIYRYICQSIYSPVRLSIYLSACLSACLKLLWDLKVESWQTQLFCGTSSLLELSSVKDKHFGESSSTWNWQHQNRRYSDRLLQKWNVECRTKGRVPMHFAIYLCHVSKVPRLPRKSEASAALSHKITLTKPKAWCSHMQRLWEMSTLTS